MGGSSRIEDDWDLTVSTNAVSTMVLVGKAGNGKSATGNSILGRKAFISQATCLSVTSTCEMQSTILNEGRTVNVIDTPGLIDFLDEPEFIGKEIFKCMNLAKDGIHALLVVLSVRSRFTKEEEAAIQSLHTFFGEKITDYMIIVFTGGDEFEDQDITLKDYIDRGIPEPLKRFLQLCKYRAVIFDNKTKDRNKQAEQRNQLLSLVDLVVTGNAGQPFSDQVFAELRVGALRMHDKEKEVESLKGYTVDQISDLKNQIYKSYGDQLAQTAEMMEQKLKESVKRIEDQLAEEQAARLEAVNIAQAAQMRSDNEILKLRKSLERAQKESEEFRRRAESSKCAFL